MSWFRKAQRGPGFEDFVTDDVAALPPGPAAPERLELDHERILLTLVQQTQQLNDRLTRLEDRFETSVQDQLSKPDQQDLLELRLHSARLAAELSRVNVSLRGQIDELAARADSRSVVDATDIDDDTLIDLAAQPPLAASHGSRRASGWQPVTDDQGSPQPASDPDAP